jgi:hypothetical protein
MSRLNEAKAERIEIAKYFIILYGSVMFAIFCLHKK